VTFVFIAPYKYPAAAAATTTTTTTTTTITCILSLWLMFMYGVVIVKAAGKDGAREIEKTNRNFEEKRELRRQGNKR